MDNQEELAYDLQARNLGGTLEKALREALDDETFKKVRRMSYSSNAAKTIRDKLGIPDSADPAAQLTPGKLPKSNADIQLLDKLVSNLLETEDTGDSRNSGGLRNSIINRFRPLSRSLRLGSMRKNNPVMPTILESHPNSSRSQKTSSFVSNNETSSGGGDVVRNVLHTIRNAPQRFSQQLNKEENTSLTENILD